MNAKQRRQHRRRKGITRSQWYWRMRDVRHTGEIIAVLTYMDDTMFYVERNGLRLFNSYVGFEKIDQVEFETLREFGVPELHQIRKESRRMRVFDVPTELLKQ